MRTTLSSAALALALGTTILASLSGCGGDSSTASAPASAPAGGPPAAPGAPGAPGDPSMEQATDDGAAPADEGASTTDGSAPAEDAGSADGAETTTAELQPGTEGTPADPGNPEAAGQAYATDDSGDPDRPTVLGKLAGSIFGVAAPFVPNPNAGGEGDLAAFPDGDGTERAKPRTLKERSLDAFKQGREAEGFLWLHAHYLSRSGEAELVEKMRWVPGLRRPALAVRFGAGVIYTAPREFTGDPQPISPRLVAPDLSGGDGGGDDGRRRRRQEQPEAQPEAQPEPGEALTGAAGRLDWYAGDVGTKLVAALKQRLAAGDFGLGMQDVYAESKAPVDPNDPNAGSDDAGVAFGPTGEGLGDGEKKDDSAVGQIAPGIVWLGEGALKDLEKRAGEHGVDLLVIYEVTVKPARAASFVNNTTKFRIVTVKGREVLFNSPLLNNLKALEERKQNKAKDMVDVEVERAVAAIEAKFKPTDIPAALKPEHVLSRVSTLAAEPQTDVLGTLVEARFYQAKGLLPEKDFQQFAAGLVTAEKIAPLLSQIPPGPVPLDLLEIVNRMAPDLGPQLMQQMMQRGGLPK